MALRQARREQSGSAGNAPLQAPWASLSGVAAATYSILAPLALTTGPHFSRSWRMKSANSAGVIGRITAPCAIIGSAASGVLSTPTAAAWMRSRMSFGTADGAQSPYQLSDSTVGRPISAVVGTSGSRAERVLLVAA